MHEHMRPVAVIGDVVGPFIIAGSWMGYLSEWAAGMAILWYLLQFILAIPQMLRLWVKFSTWLKTPKS